MKNRFFLISATVSIILIVAFLFFESLVNYLDPLPIMGTVIKADGSSYRQQTEQIQWIRLDDKSKIKDKDLVKTEFKSELLVRTQPYSQIKIFESSLVEFKKENGKLILNIKSGAIEVLSEPPEDQITIIENGERIDASTYTKRKETAKQAAELIQPTESIAVVEVEKKIEQTDDLPEVPASTLAQREASTGSTNTALRNKILSQNSFFYRCYSNFLQRKPKAKGKINFSFQVENRGQVSHVNILFSDFKDNDFIQCLSEVIKRTRFEPFKGDAILTQLPLTFNPEN